MLSPGALTRGVFRQHPEQHEIRFHDAQTVSSTRHNKFGFIQTKTRGGWCLPQLPAYTYTLLSQSFTKGQAHTTRSASPSVCYQTTNHAETAAAAGATCFKGGREGFDKRFSSRKKGVSDLVQLLNITRSRVRFPHISPWSRAPLVPR